MTDWNKEMENLKNIGSLYGVYWPDELLDNIKSAYEDSIKRDNRERMQKLNKCHESMMKIRNYFRYGA